jgi:mannose-6-phosphate isomerase-like protein (cupin superfamily)
MECVKCENAVVHANSPNCTVYEYPMKNGEMDIGVAEINDRYPGQGYAMNSECSEMGYVLKGVGKLVTETGSTSLAVGDVVYIPRGEKFYWEGDMTVVLSCSPAWHPQQHALQPF